MIFTVSDAIKTVACFAPLEDGLAAKSQELILGLLHNSETPFSRSQFTPGHITCTALVTHPEQPRVLTIHHHRLQRWLLPGGHIEASDLSLSAAAAREAHEETSVLLDGDFAPVLIGMDVHGIPPKRGEPYHLHHDLIWLFRATSESIGRSDEAPEVMWAVAEDFESLQVTESIRRAARRGEVSGKHA